jgi:hypothetical protein
MMPRPAWFDVIGGLLVGFGIALGVGGTSMTGYMLYVIAGILCLMLSVLLRILLELERKS